jgi:hypothetical protein
LALVIAKRVDSHAGSEQCLYGSTTDNAKSVLKTSKLILTEYASLAARAKLADIKVK